MDTRYFVARNRAGVALLVASALASFAGCGDAYTYDLDPGHIDPDSVGLEHACFDGSEIELVRYSSICDDSTRSLTSVIHDGIVFASEEVGKLGSPCGVGPAPAVEMIFDMTSHSVLLDFSAVADGDRFPQTEFDGYMFDIALDPSNGTLVAITVDRDLSTVALDESDIDFDRSSIKINFAGTRYHRGSLLKLDLTIARVAPLPL